MLFDLCVQIVCSRIVTDYLLLLLKVLEIIYFGKLPLKPELDVDTASSTSEFLEPRNQQP